MKTYFVAFISLLIIGSLSSFAFGQTTSAGHKTQVSLIQKTLFLKHLSPSVVLRMLDGLNAQDSSPVNGIESITPKISDYSLSVRGTAEAIDELEAIVTLLDVKPRVIKVATRLFEIRLNKEGMQQEFLVESPTFSAKNNAKVQCTSITEAESTSISIVAHVNADYSIALQVGLDLYRSLRKSKFTATARLSKPQEWTTIQTVSLSRDKKIQVAVKAGGKLPLAAYPLYRLEVVAAVAE